MDAYGKSYHLLCPGPVNVRPEVAAALTSWEFCHREEEFSALLENVQRQALEVAGVRNPEAWAAVVVTGSGTAGNESVLATVVPDGGRVLVLANGEFGERLFRVSSVYNDTVVLEHDWAEPLDLERLAGMLREQEFSLVAMVHHETSSGVLNPVEDVGALCRAHGVRLFVDMVSSYSADPLDFEACGVTFASTSSGKALASYPGLALVMGRRDAFEALGELRPRNHYLNLYRYYAFLRDKAQTPNTPAVPLILALDRALSLALAEGMPERLERLAHLAAHVRRRACERGLRLLVEDQPLSNVVTSVMLPAGVDFERFRLALREEGFVVYGGKGPFDGRLFQVSTIGDVDEALVDAFFEAVDRVLRLIAAPTRLHA